jgi:hypothetical protein
MFKLRLLATIAYYIAVTFVTSVENYCARTAQSLGRGHLA